MQPFYSVNELHIKGSTSRSKGLFHRVIAQSGSNFSPSLHSITGSQASRFGTEAAVAMGCVFDFSAEARLECLQGIVFNEDLYIFLSILDVLEVIRIPLVISAPNKFIKNKFQNKLLHCSQDNLTRSFSIS